MEPLNLSISDLSFDQKLSLMETIWDEISRNENRLESPEWHRSVLDDRERALATNKTEALDWEKVKERIRQNTK